MERVLKPHRLTSFVIFLCLLGSAQSISATTAIVPPDDDLIIGARVIVKGKVLSIQSSLDPQDNRIFTYIKLKGQEVLKGQLTERKIVIKELGGQTGDRLSVVYGNPEFAVGEQVLVYLDTWRDGSLRTYQMFLGKFSIIRDQRTGRDLAVRGAGDEHVTVMPSPGGKHTGVITDRMELSEYIAMVRSRLKANVRQSQKFEQTYYRNVPTLASPPGYVRDEQGSIKPNFALLNNARWYEPDTGQPVPYTINPHPSDPSTDPDIPQLVVDPNDVAAAATSWSSVQNCALRLSYAGNLDNCYAGTGIPGIHIVSNNCDGRNSPTTGCSGILAWGGYSAGYYNNIVINGTTFSYRVTQGFVSCNPWAACNFSDHCSVRFIITHELGHALGLGHSQYQQATMYAIAYYISRCAVLWSDDEDGIRFIYPVPGGGPGPLSITTTSLPNGAVGTPYSQTLLASGGTLPYSWSLVQGSGTLPPGLTLTAAGVISGTPTTAGTYNFTVRTTDNVQATATKPLGIVVNSGGGGGALNSQFVSQSVPTTVQPGQQFTANIKFQNTGTTTWSGTQYYYASQNPALNQSWGGNGVWLYGFSAAPGQTIDVTFTATAPATPGIYNFQWQMYQDGGAGFFGAMSTNVPISVGQPTLAEFIAATVSGFEDGVLLRWQTGMELDNLGFNIYRDEFGKQTLVNKQLIAGSALTAGSGVAIRSGFTYEWWDPKVATEATQYIIEAVDFNGTMKRFGPYVVQAAATRQPSAVASAKLLSALGNTEAPSCQLETFAKRNDLQMSLSSTPQIQASKRSVKIFVKRAGFYRLTQEELLRAGLDPSVDPRTLALFVNGHEQAIEVKGESDGRFDQGDTVEFYGTGVNSPYTDTRVYWLVVGATQGKRMKIQESTAKPTAPGSFLYTVERKERSIYFAALRNGELENFFGAALSTKPLQQILTVNHLDEASVQSATLEVALQGVTQQAHEVTVAINGSNVGMMTFTAQTNQSRRFSVSPSLLRNGDNMVTLMTTGNSADVSLVDYVRLTYPHLYTAEGNHLRCTAQGGQPLTINGFTSKAIRLFDVTDPDSPQELQGAIGQDETGYQLSLLTNGSGVRDLLAIVDEIAQRPANVELDIPSKWRDPSQAAEFIIITTSEMLRAAETLGANRRMQGISGAVVNITDVYDEFSFGEKTPFAIKAFLDYARRNWRIPPRYLLLMGDASYDMKNYLSVGDFDLVPTKLVDNAFMETASDDWLADFNDDGIADFALGRLPARTSEEADMLVNKIISYEHGEPSKEALSVADSNDGFNFETVIDELSALLPANVRAAEIKRGQMGDDAAKAALLEALNRGQKLVSYVGHGSMNVWRGNLLTNDEALQLQNGKRLTFFLMMNCLNGYFVTPNMDSLAEALLRADGGGAVAVWASTSVTYPNNQSVIGQQLYRELFSKHSVRLGDAVLSAKARVSDLDVRRSWILFADPTMQLR
jgi:Peptidase family C25/Putative Ig domain/Ig-like domain from next to BRCA1 gene/Matrixin